MQESLDIIRGSNILYKSRICYAGIEYVIQESNRLYRNRKLYEESNLYITRFPGAGAFVKILSPESVQSPPFEHFWRNIDFCPKYKHKFVEMLTYVLNLDIHLSKY